jgi:outer membrane protein assembly factor BamB
LTFECGERYRDGVGRRSLGLFAAAVVLAGVLPRSAAAASVSWLTYGFNVQRTGYNASETTIGTGNASKLHKLWSRNLGDVMIAQPVEAAGVTVAGKPVNVIYEGTEHGVLYALSASTGAIIWHKSLGSVTTACNDMPDDVFGIGGAGVISFTGAGAGVLYVAGGDGRVHALDLGTGAEQTGWPVTVFNPTDEHVYGGLNLFHGNLYVTVASHCDIAPYFGRVTEISVASHAITHRFFPSGPPSGGVYGGGIWGPGGVSIDSSNGDVFAATGNSLGSPENYLSSDAVVQLSPSLVGLHRASPSLIGGDVDFGATPLLYKPTGCPTLEVAAKNKSGVLFIYSEGDFTNGFHQRIQMADVNDYEFNGIPAWDPATNMMYIGNSSDSSAGGYFHGMVALKAASNCALSLAWQQTVGPTPTSVSPPTVANGVVYYGDGGGNTEYAFNAATGQQLWTSGATIGGGLYAAPTIVNGQLIVPAWDNFLYVFGP